MQGYHRNKLDKSSAQSVSHMQSTILDEKVQMFIEIARLRAGRAGIRKLEFFIVDKPFVQAAVGGITRRKLFVTTGLLGLEKQEIDAIVSHEISHARKGLFSRVMSHPITLSLIGAAVGGYLFPGKQIASYIGGFGGYITSMFLWRVGEYAADRYAAKECGSPDIVTLAIAKSGIYWHRNPLIRLINDALDFFTSQDPSDLKRITRLEKL